MQDEHDFDSANGSAVELVFVVSAQQIDAFAEVFPEYDSKRVVISPNGINQSDDFPQAALGPDPNAGVVDHFAVRRQQGQTYGGEHRGRPQVRQAGTFRWQVRGLEAAGRAAKGRP